MYGILFRNISCLGYRLMSEIFHTLITFLINVDHLQARIGKSTIVSITIILNKVKMIKSNAIGYF